MKNQVIVIVVLLISVVKVSGRVVDASQLDSITIHSIIASQLTLKCSIFLNNFMTKHPSCLDGIISNRTGDVDALIIQSPQFKPSKFKCGRGPGTFTRFEEQRIIGGKPAVPYSWPFMVINIKGDRI